MLRHTPSQPRDTSGGVEIETSGALQQEVVMVGLRWVGQGEGGVLLTGIVGFIASTDTASLDMHLNSNQCLYLKAIIVGVEP